MIFNMYSYLNVLANIMCSVVDISFSIHRLKSLVVNEPTKTVLWKQCTCIIWLMKLSIIAHYLVNWRICYVSSFFVHKYLFSLSLYCLTYCEMAFYKCKQWLVFMNSTNWTSYNIAKIKMRKRQIPTNKKIRIRVSENNNKNAPHRNESIWSLILSRITNFMVYCGKFSPYIVSFWFSCSIENHNNHHPTCCCRKIQRYNRFLQTHLFHM